MFAQAETASPRALTYEVHQPVQKTAHPPLLVALHGRGGNEQDMQGLAPYLPRTFLLVSPRAPFDNGGVGYRWFKNSPRNGHYDADPQELAIGRQALDKLIREVSATYKVDPQRIYLAGFSQGAVMTYQMALSEPKRFRGAIILSGAIFPSQLAQLRPSESLTELDLFVAHGTADERIDYNYAEQAKASLERLGVTFDFHVYRGMTHQMGKQELRELGAWLIARNRETGAAQMSSAVDSR